MKINIEYIPKPLTVKLEPYSFNIILMNSFGGKNHAACLLGARLWTIDHLQKVLPLYDKMLRPEGEIE